MIHRDVNRKEKGESRCEHIALCGAKSEIRLEEQRTFQDVLLDQLLLFRSQAEFPFEPILHDGRVDRGLIRLWRRGGWLRSRARSRRIFCRFATKNRLD